MCDNMYVMNRGEAVEEFTREQLQTGSFTMPCTRQLFIASKGYDRDAVDRFEEFQGTQGNGH
ncbi:MAG: hypothetical protein M0O96_11490 [Desulforhopalus sp.]|nr:hypothetical protein [Desulforhopalus sp.]